jgi:hypothetical protein
MTSIFDIGSIAPPGADFASTGPHLHEAIVNPQGKSVDPEQFRSIYLSRILVGKDKTPLYSQKGSSWSPAFPLTSKYGPRIAPTAGASTYHEGADYGIPQGTPLAWLAKPGDKYTPKDGYGELETAEGYKVKFLHTKPGAATHLPLSQTGPLTAANTSTNVPGNTYNFYLGKGRNASSSYDGVYDLLDKFLDKTGMNNIAENTGFDPMQALSQTIFKPAPSFDSDYRYYG